MMPKLLAAALACAASANQVVAADSLLGQSEPAGYADRIVVVTPDTAFVNVNRGDVVRFVSGGKSFSWNFATPANISVIDMDKVAPAGFFPHSVKAYIKRIPIYDGG